MFRRVSCTLVRMSGRRSESGSKVDLPARIQLPLLAKGVWLPDLYRNCTATICEERGISGREGMTNHLNELPVRDVQLTGASMQTGDLRSRRVLPRAVGHEGAEHILELKGPVAIIQ